MFCSPAAGDLPTVSVFGRKHQQIALFNSSHWKADVLSCLRRLRKYFYIQTVTSSSVLGSRRQRNKLRCDLKRTRSGFILRRVSRGRRSVEVYVASSSAVVPPRCVPSVTLTRAGLRFPRRCPLLLCPSNSMKR